MRTSVLHHLALLLALLLSVYSLFAGEEVHSFYISNHDQSPAHRVIHPIVGKTNFVYDAKGALELVKGEAIAQNGRAEAIKRYVRSTLEHPLIVGAHWHQYSDQATSGRFDGEHFQVGLTDICDRPYPETIQALREIGYPMYDIRMGK